MKHIKGYIDFNDYEEEKDDSDIIIDNMIKYIKNRCGKTHKKFKEFLLFLVVRGVLMDFIEQYKSKPFGCDNILNKSQFVNSFSWWWKNNRLIDWITIDKEWKRKNGY